MRIKIVSIALCLLMTVQPIMADEYPIKLEDAAIDTHDSASVERGAKIFATTCLVCHSLQFMEHDPFAKKAGITRDKMPNKDKNWWFGSAPPDLTLEAKIHSADWLYTYLHVFYKDPSRPSGSNNLLIDNSNMPNPFAGMQGEQQLLVSKQDLFKDSPLFVRKLPYYVVLDLTRQGTLTPDQFDKMILDLVNFLVYASEPKKYARELLGIWVLLVIFVLIVLVYLLKRVYWKQVNSSKE